MVWKKGRPAHNRKVLSEDILKQLVEHFRTCEFTLDELRHEFGLGRNKTIGVLKQALGDEYTTLASQIVQRRAVKAIKLANTGRKHPPRSKEWRTKISQAKKGQKLSKKHRNAISKTLRKRGAINPKGSASALLAGQHAAMTKHHTGAYRKFARKIRRRWKQGRYRNLYGSGTWRSKIEKRVFRVLQGVYDVKHTFILQGKTERYAFDIAFPERKLLVEVNGDYWHCNPKKYEPSYFHRQRKQTANEVWEYDEQKQRFAESMGFSVLVLWESDLNSMTDKGILDAIK